MGVFLIGVTPEGVALLDHQLYLHGSWYDGPDVAQRRAKVHVPDGLPFRTKPQIAAELVRNVAVLGTVTLDWVTADEGYGRNGELLDELERLEQRYVMEVPTATTVWTVDPASCVPPDGGRGRHPTRPSRAAVRSVAEVASQVRPDQWRIVCVGQGAKGPLVFAFAAVRVWAVRHDEAGPPIWLLIRRSLEEEPEVKYYVSNADAETPLEVLGLVVCSRHRVEDFFEDCKSYLGMAQYETRSWIGWHHHMTLVGLAHLFVTLAHRRLKKVTELTLDRAVRLLAAALDKPELRLSRATALVEYYVRRNKVARESHAKTWKKKHRKVKFLLL